MTCRFACVVAAMVGAVLAIAAPAGAADSVLATLPAKAQIDALAGHVLWSDQDPVSGSWQLVDYHDGVQHRVDVPDSAAAFDVDLGRDRRGRLVAVYSRCRRPLLERTFGRAGCDIYRYDFAAARETRLSSVSSAAADEREPALWGSRIVFVRDTLLVRKRLGGRQVRASIAAYARTLRRGSRARRLRLPRKGIPWDLDVRSGTVALRFSRSFSDAVRLASPGRDGRVLFSTPGSDTASQAYGTLHPTITDPRTVYWEVASVDPDWAEIWRRDLSTGLIERATTRINGLVPLFAQDRDVSYYAIDNAPDGDASPLELHRVDGLCFERAPRLTLE